MATAQLNRRPSTKGAGTMSVAIVGHQLIRALQPAHPVQIAQALEALGFDLVVPVTWGEELLARRLLYAMKVHGRVLLAGCKHASDLCDAMGLGAAGEVVEAVSPAVATARYVRALFPTAKVRVALLDAVGATTPGIDRTFSIEAVKASLVRRGLDPLDFPDYYDSIVPPDRRRHRSIPGGLPDPHALDGGYSLLRLGPADAAPRFGANGGASLVQLLPGCSCGGLSTRLTIDEASRMAALEPPRSSTPVVDESLTVDLVRTHGPRQVITKTPVAGAPVVREPRRLMSQATPTAPLKAVPVAPTARQTTSPKPPVRPPAPPVVPTQATPLADDMRRAAPVAEPPRAKAAPDLPVPQGTDKRPSASWAAPRIERLGPPRVVATPTDVASIPPTASPAGDAGEANKARPDPRTRRGAELRWRAARASAHRTPRSQAAVDTPLSSDVAIAPPVPTPEVATAFVAEVVPVVVAAPKSEMPAVEAPKEMPAPVAEVVPEVVAPPVMAERSSVPVAPVPLSVVEPVPVQVVERVAVPVVEPVRVDPTLAESAIARQGSASTESMVEAVGGVSLGAPTVELSPYQPPDRVWVRAGTAEAPPQARVVEEAPAPVVEPPPVERPSAPPRSPRIRVTPRATPSDAPSRVHRTPRGTEPGISVDEPTIPGRNVQGRITMLLTLGAILTATVLALQWTDKLCGGCIPKPYWEDGKIVWEAYDGVDADTLYSYEPR